MPRVKVNISREGKVVLEGQGFKGNSCDEKIGKLAKALGAPDGAREELLPEYHQTATAEGMSEGEQ